MSDFYDHVKRAFLETLTAVGVPITFKGMPKTCITGPLEKKRQADVSAYLPQVVSQIQLIDDDFNAYTRMGLADRSTVTVANINLRIVGIDSDPADPIVTLLVIADK